MGDGRGLGAAHGAELGQNVRYVDGVQASLLDYPMLHNIALPETSQQMLTDMIRAISALQARPRQSEFDARAHDDGAFAGKPEVLGGVGGDP